MSVATRVPPNLRLPPDEKFWQRYSPHHELPLAGMTSFFVHGMVLGVATLGGMWYLFQRESDSNKPPSMDVVQIAGMGDGAEGAGGAPGAPGDAQLAPTEYVPTLPTASRELAPPPENALREAPKIEFIIPEVGATEPKTDADSILQKLEKDAVKQAETTPPMKVVKMAVPGTGKPDGIGGQGGAGGGPGKGLKGTGVGVGGVAARAFTKAEIYANRWSFNLSGGGKEHVNKYLAMGVTVALQHPNGKVYFIKDLRRRPVDLRLGNMDKYENAVKWRNDLPGSMLNLAQELKLPFVPAMAVILLPQDREQKMADVELRYAQKLGLAPEAIRETKFDFQLRGGEFEPVVVDMLKK